jgi:hypothetical protein
MMRASTSNNEKTVEDIPMEAFLHKSYTAEEMLTTVNNILNAFGE